MFNPSTRKVIMTRDIIWSDWVPAQPEEEMPVEEVKENRKNETVQKSVKKVNFNDKVEIINENKESKEYEYVVVDEEINRLAVIEYDSNEIEEVTDDDEETVKTSSEVQKPVAGNTRSKISERVKAG